MVLEKSIDIYCSAWSEPDSCVRGNMLERVLSADVVYCDPTVSLTGCDSLVEHIESVLQDRPGSSVVRTSMIDEHHDVARFSWHLVKADGTMLPDGIDIIEIDKTTGKLTSILGFFGPSKLLDRK